MAEGGFVLVKVGNDDGDDDEKLVGKAHGLNTPFCCCGCLSSLTGGVYMGTYLKKIFWCVVCDFVECGSPNLSWLDWWTGVYHCITWCFVYGRI